MEDLENKTAEVTEVKQEKKSCKFKKSLIGIIVSVALTIVGAFLACLIQTNMFSVKVYSETITTEPVTSKAIAVKDTVGVDMWSVADIYMPKGLSSDARIPLVFVVPGIQRTKETQSSFCIELVRRGYGVICLDPYNQGESSSTYESQSATQEGYGLFSWIDYVFDNAEEGQEFDWVDLEYIGACGHSAGGNAIQKLAEREGKIASEKRVPSRLRSAYITGFLRGWTWANSQCNVGLSYSQKDEGAFQNKTVLNKVTDSEGNPAGASDLRYAPESIDIVNYQINRNNTIAHISDPTVSEVEIGYEYGNKYAYTYTIMNNEQCLHAFQPYDTETLVHLTQFFDETMMSIWADESAYAENVAAAGIKYLTLSPTNQLWALKEIGTGVMLVGGFLFICALCPLLLSTKFFAPMKKAIPDRTGDQKVKGRIIFWLVFVIGAALACYLYMVCVKYSVTWFADAASGIQTKFFPQRFTNAVMLWAGFNGAIGIVLFFLTWALEWAIDAFRANRKAHNLLVDNNLNYGGEEREANEKFIVSKYEEESTSINQSYMQKLEPLKINFKEFGLTILMALILIVSFFALDYLMYFIFHVDMRLLFVSARVSFNKYVILYTLPYFPVFFIFYFSNSLRVNSSMRPKNWPEWLSQVIAVLGNTLGLIAILFFQYVPFAKTGVVGYTDTVGPQWLFVNSLFSIIPMMFILPIMNRYFFNKTGRSWLGPIVTCIIFITMSAAATTMYYALG